MKAYSLFILLGLLSYSGIGQISQSYKIAVYERNNRINYADDDKKYKYEIRTLFEKVGQEWIVNKDSVFGEYSIVFKGDKYQRVRAANCKLMGSYDSASNYTGLVKDYGFFKPYVTIALAQNYFSKQFSNDDAELIKKAVFLSNNPFFVQHTKLKNYTSSKAEKQMLLDSAKIYLKNLYISSDACTYRYLPPGDTTGNFNFLDTVIKYEVTLTTKLLIDSANSFIDSKGNKIINILMPANYLYNNLYPFGPECFREDNGFSYFRILCYLDNTGHLSFLHDELQYLDHGDFDNDGKDEYLFWYAIFNHVGYVMYYDDFKKSVSRRWNYH